MKKMTENEFVKYFESIVNEDVDVEEIENYVELCNKYVDCHRKEINDDMNSILNEYLEDLHCDFYWDTFFGSFYFNYTFYDNDGNDYDVSEVMEMINEKYGEECVDIDAEMASIIDYYYPTSDYEIVSTTNC